MQRYFVLDKGILKYAKHGTDVSIPFGPCCCHFWHANAHFVEPTAEKGKDSWLHRCRPFRHGNQEVDQVHRPGHRGQHLSPQGTVDDQNETRSQSWAVDDIIRFTTCFGTPICGTQTKSPEVFEEWVSNLRHHRVFRQNEISSYPHPHHYHSHTFSSPAVTDSIRKVSRISAAWFAENRAESHFIVLARRGLLSPSRCPSIRPRSALGLIPQRT